MPPRSMRSARRPLPWCRRRRCRACRDIGAPSRVPCEVPPAAQLPSPSRGSISRLGQSMNPDTAEIAIPPIRTCPTPGHPSSPGAAGQPAGAAIALPAAGAAARCRRAYAQIRSAWPPSATAGARCWTSRLLVWAAGVGTVVALGFGPARKAFNPPGVTRGVRMAGRSAGGARGALGLGLVPRDRALRLPPRPRPLHGRARRVLPALSARDARVLVAWRSARARGGAALARCAFALALYGLHRLATLELGSREAASAAGVR